MNAVLVIPARYASSRLPGKPLLSIAGESMIYRTWERCAQAFPKERIYVATEDDRIAEHCHDKNMNVIMTSAKCMTGTDRIAEVACLIDADIYINVQGDEPLFNPKDIKVMLNAVSKYPNEILNGFCPIEDEDLARSQHIPKVVMRPDSRLLYMSRALIPTNKSNDFVKAWRQVCVYVFPKNALLDFAKHTEKAHLEGIEDIEILRFLEMGYEVRMIPLSSDSIAVDTPEDIEKVNRIISVMKNPKDCKQNML